MTEYMNLAVREVMTSHPRVERPDTTMDKVMEIFEAEDFNHLPILDKGVLVGIISKSDVLLLSCAFPLDDPERRKAANKALFAKLLAHEVMTRQVVRLRPDMKVSVAAGIFLENLFQAMPVVDDQDQLVGIVSWVDLVRVAYRT
jgi:acetoin utilization protein AcuB